MENDAVTNALYQCKLLNEQNCKNLKQNLTAHQMSCLNTQVILHVNEDDFVKICNYIDSQVQVKCLETLYYGKVIVFIASCVHTYINAKATYVCCQLTMHICGTVI